MAKPAARRLAFLLTCLGAAAAFPSCQGLIDTGMEEEQYVHFTAEDIGTKTVFDTPDGHTYPTLWCDGDEIAVSMNFGTIQTVRVSTPDGGATADFAGSFRANGSAAYTFYALCPASASQYVASRARIWNFVVPEDQYPHRNSPDPAAQIIAAVSNTFQRVPNNVAFTFNHVTAYGCLSFLNLDLDGAEVQSVSIVSPVCLVGDFDYYLDDGRVEESEGSRTLTIHTSDTEDIWFACAPAELGGVTLTVKINTDKGVLEKEITFPQGRGFKSGKVQKINIDMDGISFPRPKASAWAGYLELPAFESENDYYIYGKTLGSGKNRNYSYFYDRRVYACQWVAYPLTSSHTKGNGGSKSWTFNPYVPEQYQINVMNNSYGSNYGNSAYSRGHQIPNAGRKSSADMNNQTYYLTNQTPQIQDGFNGGVWSNLEDNVRSIASSTDTLYVVTGAIFQTKGGNETVKYLSASKSGIRPTRVPIPNYYYKVLLKVKRNGGNVIGASAIGIWMQHQVYSSNTAWKQNLVPVDRIEELTGFDFFVNLPDNIEKGAEANTSWLTFSSY